MLPAEGAWWKALIGQKWAESLLLESFDLSGKDAAGRLWPSFLAVERELEAERSAEDKYNFPHLMFHVSPVRVWLLRHLKPTEVLAGLSDVDRTYLGCCPESLPPEVRSPLLLSLVDCSPVRSIFNALPFFERFGFHAAPALEAYLEHEVLGGRCSVLMALESRAGGKLDCSGR